jgi:hypothetical protein
MTRQYNEPFNNLTQSYRGILYEVLKKRGFSNQELIFKWTQIVGTDLAELYIPYCVKYVKSSAKSSTKKISKRNTKDAQLTDRDQNQGYQGYDMVLYLVPKNGKDFYKFSYYKSQIADKITFFFGKAEFSNILCKMQ